MKPISVLGLMLLGIFVTTGALSQSSFAFRTIGDGVNAPVYDAYGVPLEGTGYLAELWGGVTADSLSPAVRFSDWDSRLIVPFTFGIPGHIYESRAAVVLSAPAFELAALQVRAWDASLGGTYEEVVARGLGGYGESPVFYAEGGNPGPLPSRPGSLIGLESFSLRPVIPEPSAWALFALGGLAALGFQRQRGSHWALIRFAGERGARNARRET